VILIPIEKELKRYIPENVSADVILSSIRKKYPVEKIEKQTVFDAYFNSNLKSKGYFLRVRESNGILEITLKEPRLKPEGEFFERPEITDIGEICRKLKIPVLQNKTEFIKNLQMRYGLEVIIRQKRTKIVLNGLEISLDTVEYYKPLDEKIPPIENAIGPLFKELRIYEAEVKKDSAIQTATEITQLLYDQNLLGEVCKLSKKELAEI